MYKALLTLALIEILENRQCIWVTEPSINISTIFKSFSSRHIPVSFTTRKNFWIFLQGKIWSFWSTIIVFEVSSVESIKTFLSLLEDEEKLHYLSKFTWLIFSDRISIKEIEESQLPIPLDCEFMFATPKDLGYEIIEMYKVKGTDFLFKYGEWSIETGLNVTNLSFLRRRKNLQNVTLDFAAEMWTENECKKGRFLACTVKDMFYDMEINATKKSTARWDESYSADVTDGVYFFHIFFFRHDTLGPMVTARINFYIREPIVEAHEDYFIRPFSNDLWLSILVTTIAGTCMTSVLYYADKYFKNSRKASAFVDDLFGAIECIFSQEGGKIRELSSSRMVCLTLRFVAVILIPAYSATIISFLAVRIPKIPFRNMEEFVQNGEYIMIRKEGSPFPIQYFQNNDDPTVRTINDRYLIEMKEKEGIEKTCKGKYAMITPNIFRKSKLCPFHQVDSPVALTFIGLSLKEHSPFRNLLNYALIRFYSSGIQIKIQRMINAIPIKDVDPNAFLPVDISQMVLVLMFVPGGVILATTIFIFENIFKQRRKINVGKLKNKYFRKFGKKSESKIFVIDWNCFQYEYNSLLAFKRVESWVHFD